MATIDEFKHIEMKIGTIITAEYIPDADKLLRLEVDFGLKPRKEQGSPDPALRGLGPKEKEEGEASSVAVIAAEPLATEERDIRQILSGIREYYSPEQLVGMQCPFVTNLEPRTLRGLTSNGMILAVKTDEGGAVLLRPDRVVESGSMLS